MKTEHSLSGPDSSAESAIRKTWISEARTRGISSLSVSALCKRVPCSRSTFYLYYGSLQELEQDIYDRFFLDLHSSRLIDDFLTSIRREEDPDYTILLLRLFRFFDQHESLLRLLLIEQPDPSFSSRWKSTISERFKARFCDQVNATNGLLIEDFAASALLSLYSSWLNHPENRDLRALTLIIARLSDTFFTLMSEQ